MSTAPRARHDEQQPFTPHDHSVQGVLARVEALYNDGQCVDAWSVGKVLGALHEWPGVDGRQLAGRLANHIGASRTGTYLHLLNWRANRTDPGAQYYYLFALHARYGALHAWSERRRFGPPPEEAHPEVVADYHGQCAQILGALRDFDRAEDHLRKARIPDARPYWFSERAQLYEQEDRFRDALQTCRDGLATHPRYPPVIVSAAHYMGQLELYDEALALLRHADTFTQSSGIPAALVRLLIKLRRFDEVPAALARVEALTPLRDKGMDEWIRSTRAEVAAHSGDYALALELIGSEPKGALKRVSESIQAYLKKKADAVPVSAIPRIELPVPFVRQHHMTCAPATLSAISRFWDKPADHLGIAEEICYDGTPAHGERRWATTNGWATTEFRVDWDSARALIDRGIPFTLELSDVGGGHLQAVIGYDEPTGALLIRDPTFNDTLEFHAQGMIEHHSSTGPRGLALVPEGERARLDGIALPDAEIYDLHHRLLLALDDHRREDAAECYRRMRESYADHRITMIARRALAGYDNNNTEAIAATDALLARFPKDQRLLFDRLHVMRPISDRAERLAWLERAIAQGPVDAMLLLEQSRELIADDRELPAALACVRKALRLRPDDSRVIHHLADLTWSKGDRLEAVELYRLAACGADTNEQFAQAYFSACVWTRNAEVGFDFLRARVNRLGELSPAPAMTLYNALESHNRFDEAFAALDAAIAAHPENGDARLYAARQYGLARQPDVAAAHLAAARPHVRTVAWLAESAWHEQLAGEREQALSRWREIAAAEPLHLEAHRMIALLLSEMSGRAAAMEYLRDVCDRFPHHATLHQIWYDWTGTEPAAERERVLRRLLAIEPAHSWAMRELAINLNSQSRFEEALRVADEAVALDVNHASGLGIRAFILQTTGRKVEAAEQYRKALRLWADGADLMSGLLDSCQETLAARQEALAFIRSELERQAIMGDGILAFRAIARGVQTHDELLAGLRQIHAQRPELWQSWSVLVRHLADMGAGASDEALSLARAATERFARLPATWFDLARVHRTRNEIDEEIAALDRCLELNPTWSDSVLAKAEALERARKEAEAEQLLDNAVKRSPLAVELRIRLAEVVHRRGDRDRAIAIVRDAIRINADVDQSWMLLADWSVARKQREGIDEVLAFAQDYAEKRPVEAKAWLRLADLRYRAGQPDAALQTVDRVLAMHAGNVDARDFKAMVLAELRRFRDAEDVCRNADGRSDVVLDGRAAWIDAQRGDVPAAIEKLLRLVQQVPDRIWPWAQLTEWYTSQGNLKEAASAAERWAWLDSRNPVPLGWLGDLKNRLHDQKGAKEVFHRAMRMSPQYTFAAFELYKIQLAEKAFNDAARTLDFLAGLALPDTIESARVALEVARGKKAEALELVRVLAANESCDRNALIQAANSIPDNWLRDLERTLRKVVDTRAFNLITPALWARSRVRRKALGSWFSYRRLATLGEAGRLALTEFLDEIGEQGRTAFGLPFVLDAHMWAIRFHGRAWRDDAQFWGKMSFAMACRGKYREMVKWMKDWETRPGVEAWMLQNLTIALMATGRHKEGLAVLRHVATTMSQGVDIGHVLRLWSTLGACVDGDIPLAERLLHETPEAGLAKGDAYVRQYAALCAEVLGSDGKPFGPKHKAAYDQALGAVKQEPAGTRLLALSLITIGKRQKNLALRIEGRYDLNPTLTGGVIVSVIAAGLLLLLALTS